MKFRAAALLMLLAPLAEGVGFRLGTFNIGAHLVVPAGGGAAYFDYGIGHPGQPDFDKVRDVLSRINADVVALEEIHTADVNAGDVSALATSLGYGYTYVAPTTNAFDTSLRVIFLSRYPFITTAAVGSPAGAKEITRLFPVVKVDLPGTANDPTILALHLKSGTTLEDRFRRAVEMKRIVGYLASKGFTANDNFIILGDFNPSSTNKTFTELPSGLPTTFSLGSDLTFPITYSTNPLTYFTNPIPSKLDPRQLNNSVSTYDTTTTTGPTLDLFLVSPAIAGRPHSQEVYNSTLDTSNSTGLPKNGTPPTADSSVLASDHYSVFADLEMDQDYPNLSASLTPSTVNETSPNGTAAFTVTLPAVRATNLTVSVSSDDAFVLPATSTLTIPAGSLTGSIPINTSRNFITDDTRSVTFTASAGGYDPANAVLQVTDADAPYTFTSSGQTITETFTTFAGDRDPGQWSTSGGTWRGTDDGSAATGGFRSYGTAGDGSIGFLTSGTPATVTASFNNLSDKPLTSVQIGFTAEQWKSFSAGTVDTIKADLVIHGSAQAVPALTFTAATNLPTGAIAGGTSAAKSAIVSGLSITPGNSFDLRFTFAPGSGGGSLPSDVFINEFHYDNAGTDSSEFVEVVVGPGYTGTLADITLTLYNGSGGASYGSHLLSTFTAGTVTASGHRIFSKLIPGIQNGDPDGFAISIGGVLKQFISYGGTFAAINGPALGITSTDIGVKQNAEVVGQASLGLTGTGSTPGAFTWTKFTGIAYTIGQPNTNQTFTLPSQPQGIAFDNVSVTFLTDTDQDGIPDILDDDDDNDGISDTDEILFGSNPLDASSVYRPSLVQSSPTTITLSFATLTGRRYVVQSSENLTTWTTLATQSGTGATLSLPFSNSTPHTFYRVAVSYQ
jgi:endonuclease/exonuclease/phosphatase family metal-dependent hydrolase